MWCLAVIRVALPLKLSNIPGRLGAKCLVDSAGDVFAHLVVQVLLLALQARAGAAGAASLHTADAGVRRHVASGCRLRVGDHLHINFRPCMKRY